MALKVTELTKATTLNNTDLIYVVKPDEVAADRSQGMEKAAFEASLSPGGSTLNRIVSGGVVWTGTGLVYESINLIYEINGTQFIITDGTTVTLATADGSNPRLDNIWGDDLGALGKVTGTPAGSPVLPSIDETSQLSLTFALVATSATEPSNVDIRDVYLEDAGQAAEFDATESTSAARIDLANTSSPLTGTKDIKTTAAIVNGDLITFTHTTATTIVNFNYIQFDIKVLTNWGNDHLIIQLFNSSTEISSVTVDASKMDITDIVSTQTITIFKAEFSTASDTEFDIIKIFHRVRGSSAILYQLDQIFIYEDASSTPPTNIEVEGIDILSTGEGGGSKFLREDGDGTSSWQSVGGGGDALVANPLSQFAATTSAQLAGVISNETGTGLLVFNDTPTLITPVLGTPASGNISNCNAYRESFIVTCSNFETDLALDLAVGYFDFPYNFTITEIIGTVGTAPTGSSIIADVNVDGSTIITTDKVEIEATEVSTLTATTKPTITDTVHTKGQRLTVDIDQIGSTIAGQDLEIQIIGYQT